MKNRRHVHSGSWRAMRWGLLVALMGCAGPTSPLQASSGLADTRVTDEALLDFSKPIQTDCGELVAVPIRPGWLLRHAKATLLLFEQSTHGVIEEDGFSAISEEDAAAALAPLLSAPKLDFDLDLSFGIATAPVSDDDVSMPAPLAIGLLKRSMPPDEIELDTLSVDASLQGAGVAHWFLRGIFQHARTAGFTRTSFRVYKDNARAIRFYESFGASRTRSLSLSQYRYEANLDDAIARLETIIRSRN